MGTHLVSLLPDSFYNFSPSHNSNNNDGAKISNNPDTSNFSAIFLSYSFLLPIVHSVCKEQKSGCLPKSFFASIPMVRLQVWLIMSFLY